MDLLHRVEDDERLTTTVRRRRLGLTPLTICCLRWRRTTATFERGAIQAADEEIEKSKDRHQSERCSLIIYRFDRKCFAFLQSTTTTRLLNNPVSSLIRRLIAVLQSNELFFDESDDLQSRLRDLQLTRSLNRQVQLPLPVRHFGPGSVKRPPHRQSGVPSTRRSEPVLPGT